MNRTVFTLIIVAIVVVVFLAMWLAWRARARRDATVLGAVSAPTGAVLEQFDRVFYVSTTPDGEPLVRVAAPGLRYRGRAQLTIREDGVTIEVDGETPVHLDRAMLRGSSAAGRRVGKAVESGGLGLLLWSTEDRQLESSFRFENAAEQQRFATAIDRLSGGQQNGAETEATTNHTSTDSQEGTR